MKKMYTFILLTCLGYTAVAQFVPPSVYCSPSFSGAATACSLGINIASFAVTGVSGSFINDVGACNGTTNYIDNTSSMSVTLSSGSTYAATIASSASYAIDGQVWIDLNDNFVFDAGESVGGVNNYTSAGASFSIVIPSGAALGSHRMRLLVNYTGCCGGTAYPGENPCGTGVTYGEARDYSVVIAASNFAPVFTGGAAQMLLACYNGGATSINSLLQASDGDTGQTITWSSVSAPAHGTLSVSYSTVSTGGVLTPSGLTYTPATGYAGTDVFAVQVTDGIATTSTTVSVLVGIIAPVTGSTSFPVGYTTNLHDATAGGTWSSSNTAVATVSSAGVVTGVAVGSATITYTATTVCGVFSSTAAVSVVSYAASPIISTFAGINAYGYTGDGGPATSAMVNSCQGLAMDAAGNIYIAENGNNVIRKVNLAGVISTFAGTGAGGYTGDGGAATAAKLYRPDHMCFDAAGNMYITDQQSVVRKITSSGIISTIAGTGTMGSTGDGGPATAATINNPYGITIDPSGNLYVAEYNGSRIRKINTSGTISTFAGDGSLGYGGDGGPSTAAAIGRPTGVFADAAGNMYIADSYNNLIRKVNTSGTISTVAGNATYGYSGDGGPATTATLYLPWDVAVDVAGNMYIGDLYNQLVRKVNTAGIITTIAGIPGMSGITGDGGPATAAKLAYPYSVLVDGSGNIYVGTNVTVRKIGSTVSAFVTNRAPSFVNGASQSASVCQGTAFNLSSVLSVLDSDAAQTETWTVVTAPVNGSLTGFSVTATATGATVSPSGTAYTSSGGYTGLDSFKIKISDGTDSAFTTIHITVNPVSAITGAANICAANTVALSTATTGGAWTSSNTAVATVGTSGMATGITAGSVLISYTLPTGCAATAAMTVYATPSAITGATTVCSGQSTTLGNTVSGGVWISGTTSVATINATSGSLAGVAPGTSLISYTTTAGCATGVVVTVTPVPSTITGITSVCTDSSTTLSAAPSGGVWTSSDAAVATVGSTSGSVSGISAGVAGVSYTLPTGCGVAAMVTVNSAPGAGVVTGGSSVCTGSAVTCSDTVAGGFWSSGNTTIATVGSGTGIVSGVSGGTVTISYSVTGDCGTNSATKIVTVIALPAAGTITGAATLCIGAATTLSDASGSGFWSSSNTAVATVGSGTGLVTGVTAGTAVISYAVTNSCGTAVATKTVTVSPVSGAGTITGYAMVCTGVTSTLSDSVNSGVWSSSDTLKATVGAGTGIVTGKAAGTSIISYTVTNSCGMAAATVVVTVSGLPIVGISAPAPLNVCAGGNLALINTDTTTGATAFINTPEASGATTVCDCPPGYVAVGYTGYTAAWLDQFSLVCRHLHDGVLSGSTILTSSNGTNIATPYGPYVFGGEEIMVGAQMYVSAPYAAYTGFDAGITGYGQSASYIAAGHSNTTAPDELTSLIGYYTHSPNGSLFVPDGNVITGMYTYNNTYSSGVAFRYKPISSFYSYTTSGAWSSSDTTIAAVSSSGVVSGLSAGSATITYSLTNACGITDTVLNVTVGSGADAGSVTGASFICVGSGTTLSDAVAGGSWATSNTSVATVGTGGAVTGVAAGTATISYTVTTACGVATATRPITVNPLPATDSVSGPATVNVGATIALTNSTTGGTWSASNTNATVSSTGVVTGVAAGTVVMSYTVTNSCGSAFATKTVTVNSALVTDITGALSVCMGSTSVLSNTTSGGVWSSGNTSVATIGASSGVVTSVSIGTAIITYSLSGSYVTATVTVYPLPASITGAANVCLNAATTLGNATDGGSWSSSNTGIAGITGVDASTGLATGNATGTAIITYTLSTGCYRTTSLTVKPLPAPITGAASLCVGGVSVFSDATSIGVSWTSDNDAVATIGTGSGLLTGVSAGTVTITYTINTGCYMTKVVTVEPLPALISGVWSICAGGTTTLTDADGGGMWTSSIGAVATIGSSSGVVAALAAGVTNITYSSGAGCSRIAAFTVNALPAPITGPASVCVSAGITLSDAVTGGSWTSGASGIATVSASGVVAGITVGTAAITYTTTAGCSITKTITVNPLPVTDTISGPSSVYTAATITLTDATTGGTWSSSGASATVSSAGVVTGIAPGTVAITYTVSNSCGSAFATKTVTVNSSLTTAITGSLSVCTGATSALGNTTTGGLWSSSNTAVATINASNGIMTGVSAGTTTITYTHAGSYITAVATVNTTPSAVTGAANVCMNASTTLSDATTGGTWSSSNTTIADVDAATGAVTGNAVGSATITYMLASGCYSKFTITVKPLPVAISGASSICIGATALFTDATSGGLSWASSNTTVATVGTGSGVATGLSAGTTAITFTLTTGCFITKTLTVNAAPGAISGVANLCAGSTATFSCSPSGGSWSSSAPAVASVGSSTGVVNGNAASTAIITYNLSGCIKIAGVTVKPIPATITGGMTLCDGSNTTLYCGTTGGTWSSSTAAVGTIGATGIVTGAGSGTTTISYTLSTGCARTAVVTVSAAPSISGTMTLCIGNTTILSASGSGGTWTSSTAGVATVGAATGIVSGSSVGTSVISYTISASCKSGAIVTVGAAPAAISGANSVCAASTITLTDATTGGSWSSANTAIATVDITTGLVSGISPGTTTVTYAIGGACVVTKSITVGGGLGSVTGASGVCVGAMITLVPPTTGLSWSSSNTAVATVGFSSGVVTGISPGTSTITFTSYDFGTYAGCLAVLTVTVDAAPSVAAITGLGSVIIGHTITLADAISGGTWSSSNTAKATVSSGGVVTGIGAAAAVISYTVANGVCLVSTTKALTITASREAQSTYLDPQAMLTVFPNPNSGSFIVNASSPGTFIIYTLEGKELQQNSISEGANSIMLPHGLVAGLYMCRFTGSDGSTVMVRLVYEP